MLQFSVHYSGLSNHHYLSTKFRHIRGEVCTRNAAYNTTCLRARLAYISNEWGMTRAGIFRTYRNINLSDKRIAHNLTACGRTGSWEYRQHITWDWEHRGREEFKLYERVKHNLQLPSPCPRIPKR